MLRLDGIVFTLINLLILYAALRHFLIGPIQSVLEQRKQMIDGQFASAAGKEEQAMQLKGQYEGLLADAKGESRRILEDSRQRAQREYESRVNEIEAQITELLHRRSLYEKEFHIDEGWEETVNKYMAKRKLTKELVDAFVSEIVFYDGNIEVKLLYDDFLKELLKVAEEREVSSNG